MTQPSGKIFPRNLTARAAYQVPGNPSVTRLEDAVANCYPGLELDVRNLDRRFFPGLVFEFVARDDNSAPYTEPQRYGAWLHYVDNLLDPEMQSQAPEARKLYLDITFKAGALAANNDWYIEWIEQNGKRLSMRAHNPDGDYPLDGLYVWRLVRGLEPGPLTIGLKRRDPKATDPEIVFTGWRRRFTDPVTGVISGAYQPGEFLQSLCSPWQHDFRDCACMYWASNHPDAVYQEIEPGERVLPDDEAADVLRANLRVDWLRSDRSRAGTAAAANTIGGNRPYQYDHFQINRAWENLNIILDDTEIGSVYAPPSADFAKPFGSPAELAKELRETLAPMEMALAIEYLYARFSVHSPEEAAGSKYRTMAEDVTFVRHYLMLTAASEMQHLRWANEMLWVLYDAKLIPAYEPVLHPAEQLPDGHGGFRKRALRRLTADTLHDFIEIERPSGFIDGTYARVVSTLRDPVYPAHAIELAKRIDSDGMLHFSRFREIAKALTSYAAADTAYPYLRDIHVGTEGEAAEALRCFHTIVDDLGTAYRDNADGKFAEGAPLVAAARSQMHELLGIADALAAKGIGIPFWKSE